MISDCPRAHTRPVTVGDIVIGGGAPVVVQSMTSTDTADATATLGQVRTLAELGCDLVRVTLPHADAIDAFHQVCGKKARCPSSPTFILTTSSRLRPSRLAPRSFASTPGNIGSWDRVDAVVDAAGEAGVALRIGVNAGSLERTVAERDDLTLPEKLLASSLQFVEHIEGRGFTQMVLSAKAHDVTTTIETYRALSCTLPRCLSILALRRQVPVSREPSRVAWG